ncbi:MAG: divalent-cation tolerance protein CutA [Thermoplasmata archaeon]
MTPYPVEPVRATGPVRLILSTFPDRASARRVGAAAVESHRAACVSYLTVESSYWWKGRRVDEPEVLALFKTAPKRVGSLVEFLRRHHPNELPEILEVDVTRAHPPYVDWVDRVTGAEAEEGRIARLSSRPAAPRARGGSPPRRTPARRRPRSK